ncbi:MAG: hypothetical protein HDT44_10425 [Ruminococcaceae bacterium]|nr:hypothetical protein [Oscillospiraceae bacterium]
MNANMEKMIELVSKKLGIPQEKLKASLEKGSIEDMLSDMKKEDAEKLRSVMNNSAAKEKLLKSSEAEQIMKKMGK